MVLSDISIKNPVFAWMLMFGLIFFGWISYSRMGISQMPDVDFPIVSIDITYEGASPEIIETDIVDVVEDAVISVEGIRELRSTSRQSSAGITIELDINRDVDIALQEIQTKVTQSMRLLPKEIDPPIITKRNPEDFPILWIAVTSDKPLKEMMSYVRYNIKDRYQIIPGVADIMLGGYVDRNLRIKVDSDRLAAYELSIDDVLNTINQQHIEVPGGLIENSNQEFVVRSMGEASNVKALEEIPISTRGGAPIYRRLILKNVADIVDDLDDIRRFSRFNEKPAVGLGIMKQRKSNAIEIARDVKKLTEDLKSQLPDGYNIQIANDTSKFIEDSTHELVFTIILSTLLTSLVCLLFLGSFSSTFNVLLAIPTSLFGTFIPLYFLGFTLNTFTLLALSLAIGVVVDDAIMVLENISRYSEMGEHRVEAARKGARQITFAALAATLAVIAIFLPVAFMSGIIGKYFLQFGVTISVAVFLSLIEALTLTPMRLSRFMDTGTRNNIFVRFINKVFASFSGGYKMLLTKALNRRIIVIIVSIILFICSFLLLIPIKKEFVPSQDQSMFIVRLRTPVGSSIDYTDKSTKKVEEYLLSRKEVLRCFSTIGGYHGGQVNLAQIFVTMKEPELRPINTEKKRPLTQSEFASSVRKEAGNFSNDILLTIQDLSMRQLTATRGVPVEFIIRGPDWDTLGKFSKEILQKMKISGKMVDVDMNYDEGQPEIQVYPDRKAADLRGVSMSSIGNAISSMIGGKKIGKFTEGGHRYDIRVRLKESHRSRADDIKKLYVRNNRGELVRLSEVVNIMPRTSLLSITRVNRERTISFYASPAQDYSQQEAIEEAMKITKSILPAGYSAELTGAAKTSAESFNSLLFALVIGIVISYMILGTQFNSYINPLTVLLALPFSFSGAIAALLVLNQSLNLYSFIGLILLMGIVKKNSILLVEFTNQVRKESLPVKEALIKACPIRLRPIVMTSLATIAAAVPPALALGPGAETRIPMAVAILGGVIFSTLLTLFVVPCAYSLLSRWEKQKEPSGSDVKSKKLISRARQKQL